MFSLSFNQHGRLGWLAFSVASVLIGGLSRAEIPASVPATAATTRPRFTVSKETTRIVSPLLPDGRVDYVRALDHELSKGVTAENNLAVEILATCEVSVPENLQDEMAKRLGLKGAWPRGEYTGFRESLTRQGIQFDDEAQEQDKRSLRSPWTPEECPAVAKWLEASDATLNRIARAAGREKCYWPLVATTDRYAMVSVILPSLSPVRSAGQGLAARAMLRLGQGKTQDAAADILALHRLGRLASQGPTLIDKLVAMSIEAMAARADIALAAALDAKGARAYLAELSSLPPMGTVASAIDRAERHMALDAVLTAAQHGLGSLAAISGGEAEGSWASFFGSLLTAGMDWDDTLRAMNGHYDTIVSGMSLPTFEARQAAMAKFEGVLIGKKKRPKQMADLLAGILLPAVTVARVREDLARQQSDLGMLAIALAAYRGEKGSYPATLGDLAPGIVKSVPKDVFSGGDLPYRKEGEGYTLWSVGRDRKDGKELAITVKK